MLRQQELRARRYLGQQARIPHRACRYTCFPLDNSTAKSIGCSHSREFKLIVQLGVKETWFEPSRFTNKVFGCFGQNRRDRRFEEADTNISAPTSNHARTNHSRCSQSFGGALEGHQIVGGSAMPRRGATGQKGEPHHPYDATSTRARRPTRPCAPVGHKVLKEVSAKLRRACLVASSRWSF